MKKTNPHLCQFPFADGRSCRMPRSESHAYLCVFHADRERRLMDQQALDAALADELFGPSGELRTAADVNAYLTRLNKYAVAGRISPDIFNSLVYAASLLIQTLPRVESEVTWALGFDQWKAEIQRLYSLRKSPNPSASQGQQPQKTHP